MKNMKSYSMPALMPPFTERPWHYKNRTDVMIFFKADTEDIARMLLPSVEPPIEPDPEGLCSVYFSHTDFVHGFGTGYNEMVIGAMARFMGQKGFFISYVFVDSDVALIAGREVEGAPKRMAKITINKEGELITGSLVRDGIEIIQATMKPLWPAKPEEIPPVFPPWLLKRIPSVEGPPAMSIDQLVSVILTDIQVKEVWKGVGRVAFTESVIAPFAALKPKEYLDAFYIVQEFKDTSGKVIYDFLKEGNTG